jgi:hypothetical protein
MKPTIKNRNKTISELKKRRLLCLIKNTTFGYWYPSYRYMIGVMPPKLLIEIYKAIKLHEIKMELLKKSLPN